MSIEELKRFEDSLPAGAYFTDEQRNMLMQTSDRTAQIQQERFDALDEGGHKRDHWMRVSHLAGGIAVAENIPPFMPVLSGLIHDVGRVIPEDPRSKNYLHGQLSVEVMADFIDQLPLSKEQVALVLAAVEDHPYLNDRVRESDVVKPLMDADRLDGLGATFVTRAMATFWREPCMVDMRSETPPQQQRNALLFHITRNSEWYDMMWTKTGKIIAEPKIRFMEQFGAQYLAEAELADNIARKLGL